MLSRKDASRAVRAGRIRLNGEVPLSASVKIDENSDRVTYMGEPVIYRKNVYVMLNKPEGYVSATEDSRGTPVVTELLDERDASRVFPCGRLDKYTVGLMLLTDDGELAHRLLSPARHVPKRYAYGCASPLSPSDAQKLRDGVYIEGGHLTVPCDLDARDFAGEITIFEGRYHQIKQMFGAVGNEITALERLSFGPLELDGKLARGEWRYLTDEEVAALYAVAELEK